MPGAGPCLGIEIGGTKLQLAVGAGDGRIAGLIRRPVPPGADGSAIRAIIADAASELIRSQGPFAAAGIGFGGPVDALRGVVTVSNQIGGWADFPLVDWARNTLGIDRVVLQNDADTAGLAEALLGAGKALSPVLYVNSGSGIGGALIIDGHIYRGAGQGAVEIGHLRMREPNAQDAPRTLESLASGWGIGQAARNAVRHAGTHHPEAGRVLDRVGGNLDAVAAPLVAEMAGEFPNGLCAGVLATATTEMGRALAIAVTLLAPRRVVLGGGVSLIADHLWLEPIRRACEDRVFPPFLGSFDIVTAALGDEVVVHGALALAAEAAGSDATSATSDPSRAQNFK